MRGVTQANNIGPIPEALVADPWQLHADGYWLLVPTNLSVRRDGRAVMGAGVAAQAAQRFQHVPLVYGEALRRSVQRLVLPEQRLLLAPTRTSYDTTPSMHLIAQAFTHLGLWMLGHPGVLTAVPVDNSGYGNLPATVLRSVLQRRVMAPGTHLVTLTPQRQISMAPRRPANRLP